MAANDFRLVKNISLQLVTLFHSRVFPDFPCDVSVLSRIRSFTDCIASTFYELLKTLMYTHYILYLILIRIYNVANCVINCSPRWGLLSFSHTSQPSAVDWRQMFPVGDRISVFWRTTKRFYLEIYWVCLFLPTSESISLVFSHTIHIRNKQTNKTLHF